MTCCFGVQMNNGQLSRFKKPFESPRELSSLTRLQIIVWFYIITQKLCASVIVDRKESCIGFCVGIANFLSNLTYVCVSRKILVVFEGGASAGTPIILSQFVDFQKQYLQ